VKLFTQAGDNDRLPLSAPLADGSMHVDVPRGTILAVPVNVVQTDPTVWGADAHEFNPERWFEIDKKATSGIKGHAHAYELLAFSRG
jgi:cytochrome P450